ncbi:transcriptional repressor LexA [Clostridium paraputrificum]|uniref:transcriptional repressor LexA n=1 Tax=Clostridium TaxID=1485 RepID=UPI003D357C4E
MKLLKIQKKFIESKPVKYNIVKGKSNTGKTETLLHRVLNLVNNFAYEEEDKILFVQKEKGLKEKYKDRYKKIKDKYNHTYISLLSSQVDPEFLSLNELVDRYASNNRLATFEEKTDIIKDIIKENHFNKCKKLKYNNIHIILNEIKYMKNSNITSLEEYMTLMGGPLKLRKNSVSRSEVYILFEAFNKVIAENNLFDDEDKIRDAINNVKGVKGEGYVHIFIDNVEQLSKIELEFLLALYNKKSYGTITMGIDVDKGENVYSELVKKGRVYAKKVFGNNKKIYNFKVDLLEKNFSEPERVKTINVIEKYKFIDLKRRRNFEFSIEHTGYEERILGEHAENYSKDELEEIPVFNNIAAGEPILITPEQEDIFSIPKYWVKGSNKKFILKVKGNSMINANIHNGDLVVIEQTPAPQNGDIVAVNIDGNATLKTLKVGKTSITLIPENEAYEPIVVSKDEEFYVLGKAVGVIRK